MLYVINVEVEKIVIIVYVLERPNQCLALMNLSSLNLVLKHRAITFINRTTGHWELSINVQKFLVYGSLAVACWIATREVRGSNPGQGRNLDRDFWSMCTLLCLWYHKSVDTRASPKPGADLE